MKTFKEYLAEAKLVPDSVSPVMSTADLIKHLGKTRVMAMIKHPFYQKHIGGHEATGHQVVHKVLVDKYGYPSVMSSSAFTYENHKGQKTRKMIQTSLSHKADTKVHQMHLYYNHDNRRHRENEGGGPVWEYSDSLHNDEKDNK